MKLTLKSLIMALIVVVSTAITTTGIPSTTIAWEIMGITTAGSLLGYIAQAFALPSTSILGDVNGKDFFKGVLIALANFLSGIGASLATSTAIDWKNIIMGAVMVAVLYTAKQFATPPTGIPPTK